MDVLAVKIKIKFDEIDQHLAKQAETNKVKLIQEKILKIEKTSKEKDQLEVMKESYEKRLNVLIYHISDTSDGAWESPLLTIDAIHKFMKDGLFISKPTTVSLADHCRLPQKPLFKNGVKVTTYYN